MTSTTTDLPRLKDAALAAECRIAMLTLSGGIVKAQEGPQSGALPEVAERQQLLPRARALAVFLEKRAGKLEGR